MPVANNELLPAAHAAFNRSSTSGRADGGWMIKRIANRLERLGIVDEHGAVFIGGGMPAAAYGMTAEIVASSWIEALGGLSR